MKRKTARSWRPPVSIGAVVLTFQRRSGKACRPSNSWRKLLVERLAVSGVAIGFRLPFQPERGSSPARKTQCHRLSGRCHRALMEDEIGRCHPARSRRAFRLIAWSRQWNSSAHLVRYLVKKGDPWRETGLRDAPLPTMTKQACLMTEASTPCGSASATSATIVAVSAAARPSIMARRCQNLRVHSPRRSLWQDHRYPR